MKTLACALLCTFCSVATAASTVRLPPWSCSAPDTLLRSGFDAGEAIPHDPSGGSGGAYPGNVTRTVAVTGVGSRDYFLRLPPAYAPGRPVPLLLAFHGAAGSQSGARSAAQQVRTDWAARADAAGFAVLAPVGNSTQGGWGASGDLAEIDAAIGDAFARYDIEQSRVYLWGFSAGAHYGHWLALANPGFFAAYGVSAGSLEQYACTDDGSWPPTCAALLAGTWPKIPVDIHLGNADPLYLAYGAGGDPQRFRSGGWVDGQTLHYTLFAGGHTYTVAQLGEIWQNLCPFALGP
jgi:predicted esterase